MNEETPTPREILSFTCRHLAIRMQHRVESIEERYGDAAMTSPGPGISYLFAKEIVDALQRAAEELER